MPKEYQIKLPHNTTGKNVKVEENCELPWDVLHIIAKRLDFDDLFHFAGVCTNWRAFHKIYWRNFLTSQKPLLLHKSYHGNNQSLYTLGSISDQKDYCLKMKSCFIQSTKAIYVSSSGRYFIMLAHDNSFLLINPFTRIKKVINVSTFEVKFQYSANNALLAFGKSSEEFVLVVICDLNVSRSLNVYQSRNCGWVTYSTMENQGRVVNFVVFQYKIYVITDKANIGVLNLNSASIKFLELKSTPRGRIPAYRCWLVCCDEQLLMVDFIRNNMLPNVYKIDFSTMSYVKLETLGDIALFYATCRNCYALSDPNRWGYQSNSVYIVDSPPYPKCTMYSWDDKKLQKDITLPSPTSPGRHFALGWSFRHLRDEVDYSLVE
ncbi:unnamed protein product [Trifolium pratense]|uniref:Uncharacterized protein n=1 Tax=Trifolium pratense TaxID=57577 RepID=A0ACB0IQ66_TRIPR|nr:unnamed protein product [Trifolium pratense]